MTARKQIRDAVKAVIQTYDSNLTVRSGRVLAFQISELPGISVYFDTGNSEVVNMRGDSIATAVMRVDITDSNSGGDDALDTIGDAIVDAVLADSTLRNLCKKVRQSGFDYARDEQSPYVTLSLLFEVIYLT